MCTITDIYEQAARYIVPDCLKDARKMFERNTSNIKEANGGMLLNFVLAARIKSGPHVWVKSILTSKAPMYTEKD